MLKVVWDQEEGKKEGPRMQQEKKDFSLSNSWLPLNKPSRTMVGEA